MAIRAPIPVNQPLAKGLLQTGYSPWSKAAGDRSGLSGLPGLLTYAGSTGLTGSSPDRAPNWSTDYTSTLGGTPGTGTTTGGGLPMPTVPGYKYVYPKWTFSGPGGWQRSGSEEDRTKAGYDYFPYWPTNISSTQPILVGVELIKE